MKRLLILVSVFFVYSLLFISVTSAGPVLQRIIETGELKIGTTGTQPPMTATNKNGKIIGMDADISMAMADAFGVKLKFVTMPFEDLLPSLEAGKVDMVISGMTMNAERNKRAAFVGPYLITGKGILAVAERFAALKEAKGLNTPEVAVAFLKGSTSHKFAEESMPMAKLTPADSYDEAIDLLLRSKVDVIVADFQFCALTAYRQKDKGLIAGEAPLTFEPLGIAMPEDTLLINWVQNFLIGLNGNKEIKKMQEKWFNIGSWIDELP